MKLILITFRFKIKNYKIQFLKLPYYYIAITINPTLNVQGRHYIVDTPKVMSSEYAEDHSPHLVFLEHDISINEDLPEVVDLRGHIGEHV
jgi:hypothetical protein